MSKITKEPTKARPFPPNTRAERYALWALAIFLIAASWFIAMGSIALIVGFFHP